MTWTFFVRKRHEIYWKTTALAINRIITWTNKNGFLYSTDKTHCVYFCRVRGVHPDPEIFWNQHVISVSETAKFLGVVFDKKITFLPHIFQLLLNLYPWNFKQITFINPFENFDKSNTTANIYCSLLHLIVRSTIIIQMPILMAQRQVI